MKFDDNQELLSSIKKTMNGVDFVIHEYGDLAEEYSYLKEDEICIAAENIVGEEAFYIDIADEMTLTIGAWHEHYDYSIEDYGIMLQVIEDYIKGRICVLEIYCYKAGELKWFASDCLTEEKCNMMPVKKVIKRYIDKKNWPISGKAVIRFFDVDKTKIHDFTLGNI